MCVCVCIDTGSLDDLGSIPGRVIPKTLKWYLIPPCLTLRDIRYVSRVKWSNLRGMSTVLPYILV